VYLVVKVFVVYDSKYGNTKKVAEEIVEGLKEVGGIETSISYVKEADLEGVADADALIVGAPNHMGNPSMAIKKFIDKLAKLNLKAKGIAFFDTYYAKKKNFEKALKKMEKRVNTKRPDLKLIMPGLSIKVNDVSGPIAEGELPKCRDFGRKIASQLKTQSN